MKKAIQNRFKCNFNTPPIANLKNSITFALPLTPKNKVTILNNPFNEVEVRGYGFKRVLFLDMEKNKNITAVEWLEQKGLEGFISPEDFEKAKEMEREQIIEAFWNGDNTDCLSEQNSKEFAEQYYNETYGNK